MLICWLECFEKTLEDISWLVNIQGGREKISPDDVSHVPRCKYIIITIVQSKNSALFRFLRGYTLLL